MTRPYAAPGFSLASPRRPSVDCRVCLKPIERPGPLQKVHSGNCHRKWQALNTAKLREKQRKAKARKAERARIGDIKAIKPKRDRKYLAWLRGCGCVVCKATPCDPAHVGPIRGLGQKCDDAQAIPLCRHCHELQHKLQRAFWLKFNLDRETLILAFNAAYAEAQRRDAA